MAMTPRQIRLGLQKGGELIQNKRCSTRLELDTVDDLEDEGKVWVTPWEHGRCRACGFSEYQRKVTWRSDVIDAEVIETETKEVKKIES